MLARKRAHVFDYSGDSQETATRHVGGANSNFLCRDCRRRDDNQISARQHSRQTHLHVAGARRHVDQQIIKFAPVHVFQELFDCFCEHQTTPHQRRAFVFDEHARADDFQQAFANFALVWNHLWFVAALDEFGLETV